VPAIMQHVHYRQSFVTACLKPHKCMLTNGSQYSCSGSKRVMNIYSYFQKR